MAETIAQRVGRRAQSLRKNAHLTQAVVGERAGISVTDLSRLENGHRTPTLETLERLAPALGVELRELFEEPALEERTGARAILTLLAGQDDATVRRAVAVVQALVEVG